MKRSRWLRAFSGLGAFAMIQILHPPAYHVYCDEFGDPSLKVTASEWFLVSAVVVAAERADRVPGWIDRILDPLPRQRGAGLHFRRLSPTMKTRASRFLSHLPVRCFVLLSHKSNMIGHRNRKCEERYAWRNYLDDETYILSPRNTYYQNFVLKVLLERVSAWCYRHSMRVHGEPRRMDVTIAQRGGFYISDFKATLEIDRMRSASNTGVLPYYLAWPVVDVSLVRDAPAAHIAGLQLADIVTGAFSRAIDEKRFGSCDRQYAKYLARRMARNPDGQIGGFGVTGLPWNLTRAKLSVEQQTLFRDFGYIGEKLVRPGPPSTERF
jgi:hypothetical protein